MKKIYLLSVFLFSILFSSIVFAETEPNNTPEEANIIALNGTQTGTLSSSDNQDWFKFTLITEGAITFNAVTDGTLQVNNLKIYDQNGTSVIATGTYGDTANVTYNNLLPGIYYLKVPLWSLNGSYTITNTFTPAGYPNDAEPNDLPKQAILIQPTDSLTGRLAYFGNNYTDLTDWYKVVIPEDGKIDFHVVGESTLQVNNLKIYDIDTTTIIATGSYGVNAWVTHNNLLPGTYFLKVPKWSGYGSYYITSKFTKADLLIEVENNDSAEVANTIFFNDSITAHIGYTQASYTDKEDWYKFTIPLDGKMDIQVVCTTPLQVNNLIIYDVDATKQIASGSYGATASVSHNNLMPGTYYIKVPLWSNYGSYSLTTKFTPAAYDVEVEPNDSAKNALILNVNDSATAHMGYYTNNYTDLTDWYKFTIPQDGKIEVSVKCTSTLQVNNLKIYDTDTTKEIASGTYGVNAAVSYNNLLPGTYFIKTPHWSGFGSYYIVTKFTPAVYPNDKEPNDSAKYAITLNPNDSLTAHLAYYGSNYTDLTDWYKVTIPQDGKIEVAVKCTSTLQVNNLKIYDTDTTKEIASGTYGVNATVSYNNLLPGTYFIKTPHWSGYGSYYIVTKFTPNPYPVDNLNNDMIKTAIVLSENDTVNGHLGYYGSNYTDLIDFWKIIPSYSGLLQIKVKTDGLLQVNNLRIFAADSTQLASGTYGVNATVSAQVKKGLTYFIYIPRYTNYGGYGMSDTILPAPIANFTFFQNLYYCSFVDSSLNATSIKWDFGDNTFSSLANPSHTYATPGVFDVKLIAYNTVSSDTAIKQIVIKGIQSVVANKAGNNGSVTFYVYGGGLTPNTIVKLTKTGNTDLVADTVVKTTAGSVKASFTFTNVTPGLWDVVVEIPGDSTYTLVEGFTIEDTRPAEFWVNVTGRDKILFNRWQSYTINYGNSGNVDVKLAPFCFIVSDIPGIELQFITKEIGLPIETDSIWETIKDSINPYFLIDSLNGQAFKARVYPLFLSNVPANSSGSIIVKIKSPTDFKMKTWVNDNYFDTTRLSEYDECIMWAQATALANGLISLIGTQIPGAQCVASVSQTLYGLAANENTISSALYALTRSALACVWDIGSEIPIIKAYEIAYNIYALASDIYDNYSAVEECNKFKKKKPDEDSVKAVSSFDPNEIIGPNGFGDERFNRNNEDYNYRIYFENKADATAPAQEVFVYDTLDLTKYDLANFSLGPVNFGDTTIYPMEGLQEYTVDVDLRPEKVLIVRINAKLDTATGVVAWSYTSLDPLTMDLTEDPMGGFLPPNVLSPEGEGYVSFSCRLKENLTNGTEIANRASIIFDLNAPILTNTWVNTLDLNAPESSVSLLDPVITDTVFTVSWTGSDAESGVREYTIYYQEDNGSVTKLISNTHLTTTLFKGQYGKTYSFYSVAVDKVGNEEEIAATPDAVTLLVDNSSVNEIENVTAIRVFPNPIKESVNIEFDVKNPQSLTIEVMDIYGKKVKTFEYNILNSGSQLFTLDLGGLTSGIYMLNLVGDAKQHFQSKYKIIKQ